jgi:hypothetical protein
MYIDKKDIFKALTTMIGEELGMSFVQKNLDNILLYDGDVDEFKRVQRIKMATVIEALLVEMPLVITELREWSEALNQDGGEIEELSKRAGL